MVCIFFCLIIFLIVLSIEVMFTVLTFFHMYFNATAMNLLCNWVEMPLQSLKLVMPFLDLVLLKLCLLGK